MSMFDSTDEAYKVGRAESYPNYHVYEILDAVNEWRRALTNHADASYFGVAKIQCMRAYWLGRLRTWHDNNRLTCPHCGGLLHKRANLIRCRFCGPLAHDKEVTK